MPSRGYVPIDVEVNGRAVSDAVRNNIVDVRIEQSTSVPSQATVRISDVFDGVTESLFTSVGVTIGQPLKLGADVAGAATTLFDGMVSSLGWDQMPGGRQPTEREIVITAVDKRHKLTHGSVVQSYLNQSYADVITALVGDAGLSADVPRSGLLSATHEYLLVVGNPFEWIADVVTRAGMIWYLDGTSVVIAALPGSSDVEVSLAQLRRFSTEFHAGSGDPEVTLGGDDPLSLAELAATSSPAQALVSNASFHTGSESVADSSFGQAVNGTTTVAQTSAEAKSLADAAAARLRAQQVVAKGQTLELDPRLVPGKRLKLTDAPQNVAGSYQLSSVTHVISSTRGQHTAFVSGGIGRRSLVDLLGAGSGSSSPGFGSTPVFGTVTSVNDEDNLGRVKVTFPSLSATEESWWARVVSPGAGPDMGLQILPHVGDTVLVVFERGDLRRPVVLGGTWTTNAAPPNPDLAGEATTGWTLVNKEGAKVEMLESTADGEPVDCIHLQTRNATARLYLGEDKLTVEAAGVDVELKSAGGSMVIADNGDITIDGNNINIKGSGSVNVESGTDLAAKAGTGAKVEASANLDLKGGAQATLEGSAGASIKGATVNIN